MNRLGYFLTGTGVGAAWTYLLDPQRGGRRRSLLRDQLVHVASKTTKGADATWRDVRHRIYGTAAEVRSWLRGHRAPDDVLARRVRAKMGRYISHPAAIEVQVRQGKAILTGVVLAHEVDCLLKAVKSVKGIAEVENRLEVHKTAEHVSALQGGMPRTGEPAELMQVSWSPTTRLVAGTAGCALMARGLARRTPAAMLLGTLGFGLAARALANIETKRLFGLSPGRRGIDLQKTIVIHAPVGQVYALLTDPTNYPHFTDNIRLVRDLGDGRYEKHVAGPAGTEVRLEETVFRSVPNQFVAWRSEPNSAIKYAGTARFEAENDSATKVQIQATYNPPGGIVSHALACLAGLDPKSQMDDILMRAKSFLETGQQPHDAVDPTPIAR